MNESLRYYIEALYYHIPSYIFKGLLVVLCMGIVLSLFYNRKIVCKFVAQLVLIEYLFLIYSSTVLFRTIKDVRTYDFTPFWSYERTDLVYENALNILFFIPVGFFAGLAIKRMRWWLILLLGMFMSLSIEIIQFAFKRGFAEVDDLMHNTLGCMIGYGAYCMIVWFVRKTRAFL